MAEVINNDITEEESNAQLLEIERTLQNLKNKLNELSVRCAMLNVDQAMLFDPSTITTFKDSQETCQRCADKCKTFITSSFPDAEEEDSDTK